MDKPGPVEQRCAIVAAAALLIGFGLLIAGFNVGAATFGVISVVSIAVALVLQHKRL